MAKKNNKKWFGIRTETNFPMIANSLKEAQAYNKEHFNGQGRIYEHQPIVENDSLVDGSQVPGQCYKDC